MPTIDTDRKTAPYSLRLDPELKRLAEQIAHGDHRTLASLISKLLDQHCRIARRAGELQARP
jgi:hypothetical protein